MCNGCGDKEHDNRILKPRKGEMFSVNAKQIHDDDVNKINNFIRFARAVTKVRSEPTKENAQKLKNIHDKLIGKKVKGSGRK
jgi:hypothetical protein